MNLDNKYFDIIIDSNNSFYVVESSTKPKTRDSALATLTKIETILRDNLKYKNEIKDGYSELSRSELLKFLDTKSSEIHAGYTAKQARLTWLVRKIFSKENEVQAIHTRIKNYIKPPEALPGLATDNIREISKYLDVPGIATLAQLNRQGKKHAAEAVIKRAREFGYDGNNSAEASAYIKHLFRETQSLVKHYRLIPAKYLVYKEDKLDIEKVLQNLESLSNEEMGNIIANAALYSAAHYLFRKMFWLKVKQKVSKFDSETIEKKLNPALFTAIGMNDADMLQLLLHCGADINARDENGDSLLARAIMKRDQATIAFLVDQGADIFAANKRGITALEYAMRDFWANSTSILLRSKKLPTTASVDPSFALGIATTPAALKQNLKLVDELLTPRDHINAREQAKLNLLALAIIKNIRKEM